MADGTQSDLTPEQMAARIAELETRIAKGGVLRFKVSEKGAVSVYGLGRCPVTLYLEQWERLLSHTDELRQFIEANRAQLKIKDQKPGSVTDESLISHKQASARRPSSQVTAAPGWINHEDETTARICSERYFIPPWARGTGARSW